MPNITSMIKLIITIVLNKIQMPKLKQAKFLDNLSAFSPPKKLYIYIKKSTLGTYLGAQYTC